MLIRRRVLREELKIRGLVVGADHAYPRIQRHPRIAIGIDFRNDRVIVLVGVDETVNAWGVVCLGVVCVTHVLDLLPEARRRAHGAVVHHLVQSHAREGVHVGARKGAESVALPAACLRVRPAPGNVAEVDLLAIIKTVRVGVGQSRVICGTGSGKVCEYRVLHQRRESSRIGRLKIIFATYRGCPRRKWLQLARSCHQCCSRRQSSTTQN